MERLPTKPTRTDTLFPDPTPFRYDHVHGGRGWNTGRRGREPVPVAADRPLRQQRQGDDRCARSLDPPAAHPRARRDRRNVGTRVGRSEEHTSELQSLIRISYAVFCLKKKTDHTTTHNNHTTT